MTKPPAMPERFTKKPVTIEAVQFTEALRDAVILDAVPLPEGIKFGRANYNLKDRKVWSADFYIETLEGRMKVDIGDWIIKGVKGEFYPCKPDIFELTYDRAALQSAQPAEVSDEELLTAYNSIDPCNESPTDRLIRRLRAILAMRPQAVPMTDQQILKAMSDAGWPEHLVNHVSGAREFTAALARRRDEARGITAQGDQGGEKQA